MPFDITGVDWIALGVGLAVLAVGWFILKSVLRLTMRIFTLGCTGLVVLAIIGAVLVWLRQ